MLSVAIPVGTGALTMAIGLLVGRRWCRTRLLDAEGKAEAYLGFLRDADVDRVAAAVQEALFGSEPTMAPLLTAVELEQLRGIAVAQPELTHWDGCWLRHPVCAVLRLLEHAASLDQVIANQNVRADELQRRNERLQETVGLLSRPDVVVMAPEQARELEAEHERFRASAAQAISDQLRAETRLAELEAEVRPWVSRGDHPNEDCVHLSSNLLRLQDAPRLAALLSPVAGLPSAEPAEEG